MGLKDLFSKKKTEIKTYNDFWDWFAKNERDFYDVVKNKRDIEKLFFDQLSPKLNELKSGFFFLCGMFDADTVELVLTPDGEIKNIVFVEELVAAAPPIKGWKFTALKPALDIKNVSINMAGYDFQADNLNFYANDDDGHPDEIGITIVYDNFKKDDRNNVINGIFIFLDNYLGELELATLVDNVTFIGKDDATAELVPIEKLKSFVSWREKEFIEKYEGTRHNTETDNYQLLTATLKNGNPMIAVINGDLLKWDAKASHPWILDVEIKFDGTNTNGMPDENMSALLDEIEDKLLKQLKDSDGFLNIGRETADGARNIYLACRDFRKPSKVTEDIVKTYKNSAAISYDIYKDKYWQSFDQFMVV